MKTKAPDPLKEAMEIAQRQEQIKAGAPAPPAQSFQEAMKQGEPVNAGAIAPTIAPPEKAPAMPALLRRGAVSLLAGCYNDPEVYAAMVRTNGAVKIRLKKSIWIFAKPYPEGSTLEIAANMAADLFIQGSVEIIDERTTAAEKVVTEARKLGLEYVEKTGVLPPIQNDPRLRPSGQKQPWSVT